MWSYRRIFGPASRYRASIGRSLVIAAALVWLGACGFRPLYGKTGDTDAPAELATIEIRPIADRVGQQRHNHLLDNINPSGRPAKPRYFLTVILHETIERLAVEKSAFATRANVWLRASYSLHKAADGKSVLANSSVVVSSYNILNSEFATLMAERDAEARGTQEIAGEIRSRLAAHFRLLPATPAKP
jgi:LPS-assembly lipoprotein